MNADGPVLRDIHLPPDPSWWPPAPGWWILATLVLVGIAVLVRAVRGMRRRRRWLRALHGQIDRLDALDVRDGSALAADVSQLLRRATLLVDTRAAALTGPEWLRFLDARLGGDAFEHGVGRALLDAPWQKGAVIDGAALVALARRWITTVLAEPPRHA
ncbi:DUF4381 domain-containing protein [Dokdonella sp. MW10]|uniref:DUF4381 domain-containing protein n=1 Tax=Dokdonella sp. MW10 TaxID=2992926 RepID=UPI003F7CF5CC